MLFFLLLLLHLLLLLLPLLSLSLSLSLLFSIRLMTLKLQKGEGGTVGGWEVREGGGVAQLKVKGQVDYSYIAGTLWRLKRKNTTK